MIICFSFFVFIDETQKEVKKNNNNNNENALAHQVHQLKQFTWIKTETRKRRRERKQESYGMRKNSGERK